MDDILSSHEKAKVNDDFALWAQRKYGKIKPVEVKQGKRFRFLGMVLDFSHAGECHVLQDDHIDDIVSNWARRNQENGEGTYSVYL